MRHLLWVIVTIAATSSAMAQTPNETAEFHVCRTDAMTNYAKAKAAAFDASKKALTIDYYMAERRLEETYCMQYTRCVVTFTNPTENLAGVVAGTEFGRCLADEAAKRAQLGK
jgi:hypothetical protein